MLSSTGGVTPFEEIKKTENGLYRVPTLLSLEEKEVILEGRVLGDIRSVTCTVVPSVTDFPFSFPCQLSTSL